MTLSLTYSFATLAALAAFAKQVDPIYTAGSTPTNAPTPSPTVAKTTETAAAATTVAATTTKPATGAVDVLGNPAGTMYFVNSTNESLFRWMPGDPSLDPALKTVVKKLTPEDYKKAQDVQAAKLGAATQVSANATAGGAGDPFGAGDAGGDPFGASEAAAAIATYDEVLNRAKAIHKAGPSGEAFVTAFLKSKNSTMIPALLKGADGLTLGGYLAELNKFTG